MFKGNFLVIKSWFSDFTNSVVVKGFPGGSVVKKKKKKISLPMQEMQETQFQSLVQEDPLK